MRTVKLLTQYTYSQDRIFIFSAVWPAPPSFFAQLLPPSLVVLHIFPIYYRPATLAQVFSLAISGTSILYSHAGQHIPKQACNLSLQHSLLFNVLMVKNLPGMWAHHEAFLVDFPPTQLLRLHYFPTTFSTATLIFGIFSAFRCNSLFDLISLSCSMQYVGDLSQRQYWQFSSPS